MLRQDIVRYENLFFFHHSPSCKKLHLFNPYMGMSGVFFLMRTQYVAKLFLELKWLNIVKNTRSKFRVLFNSSRLSGILLIVLLSSKIY